MKTIIPKARASFLRSTQHTVEIEWDRLDTAKPLIVVLKNPLPPYHGNEQKSTAGQLMARAPKGWTEIEGGAEIRPS
jgi:hypothetical protein